MKFADIYMDYLPNDEDLINKGDMEYLDEENEETLYDRNVLEIWSERKDKGRKRRKGERDYKKKLKELSMMSNGFYPSGAYYVTHYYMRYGKRMKRAPEKCYYKRYYKGSRSAYLKNVSDRTCRRYTGEIKSGSMYKKIFDYNWELY